MRRRAVLGVWLLAPGASTGLTPLHQDPNAPFPSPSATAAGRTVSFPEVGAVVAVEMADTPEARAIGLGGHAPLEDGQGMLFSFPTRGRFPFWMKGMTFAIDILWLDTTPAGDGSLVVVHVAAEVAPDPPGTPDADRAIYAPGPDTLASHVLEVPAGWAAAWGVLVGAAASVE
ncbi:MAG: DUF192 domain-containing protein [Chloroflexota bacterium]